MSMHVHIHTVYSHIGIHTPFTHDLMKHVCIHIHISMYHPCTTPHIYPCTHIPGMQIDTFAHTCDCIHKAIQVSTFVSMYTKIMYVSTHISEDHIYMCVCNNTLSITHMLLSTHVDMHTHLCISTHTCVSVCMHKCAPKKHAYVLACMYPHMSVYHTCMYPCSSWWWIRDPPFVHPCTSLCGQPLY